ncbi:hypothetical protein RUMCAL_03486 [Ruminococcus callidus ATCC 27760]|uniref:Uncharacterized protein n=1 Tax=Ruminococcus callidus ATCC 27760 TaxID=411473 RepID=U2LHV6_9FIRM|nr:hypothetical protein RUMCAL_03486 [Ruminococcus callidus ATCC 27760]
MFQVSQKKSLRLPLRAATSLFKGGYYRKNIFVQFLMLSCRNRPAEFARTSLSA